MADANKKGDLINRDVKGKNWPGIATFVLSRFADPFLQYNILSNGVTTSIIPKLRGTVLPKGPAWNSGLSLLDHRVGLSPYRSILLGMSIMSMLKQNYWVVFVGQESMPPAAGAFVGVLNATINSLNALFFVCAQTSASVNGEHFPQTPLIVGSALFATGIFFEWFSEVQRLAFKKDPANKGKVYGGGLFGLSRHINYFGYTLWRAGYALAAGGWAWGAFTAVWFGYDFCNRAIPVLQKYSEEKYGMQYEHYKQATPYKFIPYVY